MHDQFIIHNDYILIGSVEDGHAAVFFVTENALIETL